MILHLHILPLLRWSAIETRSSGYSLFTMLFPKLQYLKYTLLPKEGILALGGTYPLFWPSLYGVPIKLKVYICRAVQIQMKYMVIQKNLIAKLLLIIL